LKSRALPKKSKAIDHLSSIPYLSGVDASTLTAIAKAAIERQYPAGQTITHEGLESAGLFIVHEGYLKSVKISVSGREQVVRVVGRVEVFNAIGVLASSKA
jgi:CRP-like cAMP-binding protein